MSTTRRPHSKRTVLLATAGATAAATAIATAAIPDAGGVIHGCLAKSSGIVHVIDDATDKCAANETALNWNQKGVPGATGATGAIGPAGPQGPKGDPGASGGVASLTRSVKDLTAFYEPVIRHTVTAAEAGDLVVRGDGFVYEDTNWPDVGGATCGFSFNGALQHSGDVTIPLARNGKGGSAAWSLTLRGTFAAGDTILLSCNRISPADTTADLTLTTERIAS